MEDRDQICIQSTATAEGDEEEEEWSVSCSDDDKYDLTSSRLKAKAAWEPRPDDVMRLYALLEQDGILALNWVCPTRRPPSPQADSGLDRGLHKQDRNVAAEEPEPNEFDFDDEETAATTPRRPLGNSSKALKGSGQKRTATLKNVVSDIFRHRQLDDRETGSDKPP